MSLLDSSIISTVVVTIGEDFQALSSINWTALAYTLSNVRCAVRFTSIGVISGWKTAYIVMYHILLVLCRLWVYAVAQSVDCVQGPGTKELYSILLRLVTYIV